MVTDRTAPQLLFVLHVTSRTLNIAVLLILLLLANSLLETPDRRPVIIGSSLAGGILVVAACGLMARRLVMKRRGTMFCSSKSLDILVLITSWIGSQRERKEETLSRFSTE